MKRGKYAFEDAELVTLLDLDGFIYPYENGYWVKFKANIVSPTLHIPYGINYSVTLHDRNNNRVLGYDNAHSYKSKKKSRKKYKARKITWDQKHLYEITESYEFESASQLLNDF